MTEQNGRIHNQVADLLSAYIDGEVTADERALVEAHLAACTACAHDLVTLRQTVSLLRQLPQMAAPRPFTVRAADVKAIRPARPAWWRRPWARGLVAVAAVLLCVVAVGGLLLLRGSRVGAPQASESVALRAPAEEAPVEEEAMTVEKTVIEEVEVEKEMEAAAPPGAEAPTAELSLQRAVPAEAPAPAEGEPLSNGAERGEVVLEEAEKEEPAADQAKMLVSTPSPQPTAGAAAIPTPTPAPAGIQPTITPAPTLGATPVATPPPAPETMTIAPTTILSPTLLEVEELTLDIRPGLVRVSGRLPLPEGRALLAQLWRDGQPIEWATLESQKGTVEANGRFSLELLARPETPDFNLLAAPPADYEIRIRPVDPPEPVEARIPFDNYGPPPPPPTPSP